MPKSAEVQRCAWGTASPLYMEYHDTEWGRPNSDDRYLFEKICLEGFQAGLSWLTILNKREAFRKAFRNFEVDAIVKFREKDIERLVADVGIVRHRAKIESTVNNAARAIELREEFGSLANFIWQFEPSPADRPQHLSLEVLRTMTTSPESIALSKALKKRGWTFVGPTTIYAFMQSIGLVNDHLHDCTFRDAALKARKQFKKPSKL